MQTKQLLKLGEARQSNAQATAEEMAHKVAFYHGSRAASVMTTGDLQAAYDEAVACEASGREVPEWQVP